MPLFRLTFTTILTRKVWLIALLIVGAFPWIVHHFTPGSYNPTLVEPSRVHTVWMLSWIVTLTWGLFQGASAGNDLVQQRTGEFFRACGTKNLSQLFQIWLGVAAFVIPLSLVAFLISGPFTSPTDGVEQEFWMRVNFQGLILKIVVDLQLLFVAIALGSRLGATVGFLVPALLGFAAMSILPLIAAEETISEAPILNLLWMIAPHYDLADLSRLMRFKLGALPIDVFWMTLGYLAAYGLFLFAISILLFRTHRRPFQLFKPKITAPAILIALILIGSLNQVLAANNQLSREPNPLGIYGSPLGMTFGLVMQGQADVAHHGGVTHSHDEDDHDHEHGEGHDHHHHHHAGPELEAQVTKSVKSSKNFAEFLHSLGQAQNQRYNPRRPSKGMLSYQDRSTARIMELAWRLDPTNPSNYDGMSFYLTTIARGTPQQRLSQLQRYNKVTRSRAMKETWDPGASLTAANSAMSAAIFAEFVDKESPIIDSENELVRFFYDRAVRLIRERSKDGSYQKIPATKIEEFQNQLFRLRSHLLLYESRKANPDTTLPSKL